MRSDRKRQVATTRLRHGKEFYKEIGSVGGKASPNKYTSESGKLAAKKRWELYRQKQLNKQKGVNGHVQAVEKDNMGRL